MPCRCSSRSAAANFYPRPLRGGRLEFVRLLVQGVQFLSTPSARRATSHMTSYVNAFRNFYPRPLRGGRHIVTRVIAVGYRFLSTPSARRATRATKAAAYKQLLFLSTPSARRATNHVKQLKPSKTHFYPRPPRGGRRLGIAALSIGIPFLSTPSARRATRTRQCACKVVVISIHALREEGDDIQTLKKSRHDNFYPRPPRGGRLPALVTRLPRPEFLSTPSARRATLVAEQTVPCGNISIHALREEGDRTIVSPRAPKLNFYPRPPRGGRLLRVSFPKSSYNFYPRPPRGGRPCSYSRITKGVLFLSTPSARRATKVYKDIQVGNQISIHALREEGDHTGRGFLNT